MEKTSTFTLYSENCSTPFLTSSCSTAPRLGIRARKLPLNDQHRVAFLNREDCPFASQLLSGCPLPSVRFLATFLRLVIQHIIFGLPLAALAHIAGSKIHKSP